jgi:hypothetical protein
MQFTESVAERPLQGLSLQQERPDGHQVVQTLLALGAALFARNVHTDDRAAGRIVFDHRAKVAQNQPQGSARRAHVPIQQQQKVPSEIICIASVFNFDLCQNQHHFFLNCFSNCKYLLPTLIFSSKIINNYSKYCHT